MIVRSAARKHQRKTSQALAASFAQLNLPWLAPAQLRWTASQGAIASQNPSPSRRRRTFRRVDPAHQRRTLATAADHYGIAHTTPLPPPGYGTGFRSTQDNHIPFDFVTQRPPPIFDYLGRTQDAPIILNHANRIPDDLVRVETGLSGTAKQLLTHLHTCLGVGRRDRAGTIVQRIAEQCGPNAPESVYAHTTYLEDSLRIVAMHGRDDPQSRKLLKEMQKWFEVEVRNKGVQMDSTILIIMIRAAIRSLDGSRRDRSIRRYTDLAEQLGPEIIHEVLNSEDYDDNEHVVLLGMTEAYEQTAHAVENAIEESLDQQQEQTRTALEVVGTHVRRADAIDIADIPEVMATEQKGLGLAGIKRTLETFTKNPSPAVDASIELHREKAYLRQHQLEVTAVDVAIERWRQADDDLRKLGIHTAMQSKPVAALMWQWYQALLPALEEEIEEIKKSPRSWSNSKSDRVAYGPYLELLPLQTVAANTILYTMSKMMKNRDKATGKLGQEAKLTELTLGLSKFLEDECRPRAVTKKPGLKTSTKAFKVKHHRSRSSSLEASKTGSKISAVKRDSELSDQTLFDDLEWSIDTKVKLGAMLLSKLIETAHLPVTRVHPRTGKKITQMQPAFLHRLKYQRGKRVGLVVPNPALIDKIQSEPLGALIAKRMPMVVEPKPWTGWAEGGYLHYPNNIIRLPIGDGMNKDYFLAADKNNELDTVYKGLTALGKVPWKVNHDVLRVQLEAWNSGDAIANFAPLHPELHLPPEPDLSADPILRRKWLAEVQDIQNRKSGLHSQRCFQNFQLEIARTVLNETLYFPHNLDFRGRAYPIPPYLNHMGADNVRGLLTFAQGKELGETGLRWLKIHMATVAGHDKASMEERVDFTMSHLDDIYDSVRDPLGGRRWWLRAEDAWQTLAACFELTKALDSPDPTKFVSCLPVQQDGTCNGLQHYAALGGDKVGAAQVNLEPSDRPADVYTAVAEAVKVEVARDAELGHPVAQKLHGRLTRKCVKQPVMTNVYGVTFFGAKEQVANQLEVLFPEVNMNDPVNIITMSYYVTTKIFSSLGSMFEGAQAIQNWLGQCADRISTSLTPEQVEQLKSRKQLDGQTGKEDSKKKQLRKGTEKLVKNDSPEISQTKPKRTSSSRAKLTTAKPLFKQTVVWTTPLRLPVVQPYRNTTGRVVMTNMQGLSLQEPQVWDPVSKRKQLQAFPPNFIHSLDATHMLLSAIMCDEKGLTFASVHDSFWTHACDVNRMSEILRDAFVAMHSEDIIGRLREEFQTRYQGCMYLASVTSSSAAGKKIIERRTQMARDKSIQVTELALEAERMRLVNSEDARERAQGEAMITPGSIFLSEADDSAFAAPTEMKGQMLGEIPNAAVVESTSSASNTSLEDPDSALDGEEGEDSLASSCQEESAEAESGEYSEADRVPEIGDEEGAQCSASKSAKGKPLRKIYVWLPLAFPEVPKKGDFDVRRLRESRYFFH